mmetsp:Transcript_6752/g.16520  ORF Transcript_6752/g.16520 Transcript_6752/m.16520 type:complete len:212 (+) Transcript_6752:4050-4685(+)
MSEPRSCFSTETAPTRVSTNATKVPEQRCRIWAFNRAEFSAGELLARNSSARTSVITSPCSFVIWKPAARNAFLMLSTSGTASGFRRQSVRSIPARSPSGNATAISRFAAAPELAQWITFSTSDVPKLPRIVAVFAYSAFRLGPHISRQRSTAPGPSSTHARHFPDVRWATSSPFFSASRSTYSSSACSAVKVQDFWATTSRPDWSSELIT